MKYFIVLWFCEVFYDWWYLSCSVKVSGFVLMLVVYLVLLNVVCFLSLGV